MKSKSVIIKLLSALFLVLFLLTFGPFILLGLGVKTLYGLSLQTLIWLRWNMIGRLALFVYSDSPNWKEYIEDQILPHLGEEVVLLNWSERKNWKRYSLPVLAFYYFGGTSEFNPLGVVFRPFRRTQVFRFWKPFKDYKHGNVESLQNITREFLHAFDSARGKKTSP